MGLIKRNGYEVKGVTIPQAYAKINRLYMENGNHARVYFGISSDRENLNNGLSLEEVSYECLIDKNGKVYEQIYNLAKTDLFEGWEDDIVIETQEPIENESQE